jgi:Nuclease A inhibitor-like protein
MPTSETVKALGQAAEGLTYQSDTDAPWKAFAWPTAKGDPAGATVRQLGKHKASAAVEEKALDEFFAPLVGEQDWYGDEEKATAAKYRGLLDAVKRYLTGAKVIRVGGRKKTVYVVGTAKEGGWAGLKTIAVET